MQRQRAFVRMAGTLLIAFAMSNATARAQGMPAPAVVVAPAEMTDVRASASFTGRVAAIQKVDIRARVSGFVEEVAFKEGETVAEGALLYRIQDDAYRAAVAEIEGSIQAAEADRRLAEIERDRKATLVQRQAGTQAELDIAQAQLGRAEGQLAQLNGTLARAQLDLSYTRIGAPFSGIVGVSAADVGALVGPDSGALTTLVRLDPIEVTFPVATALVLDYQEKAAQQGARQAVAHLRLPNGKDYPETGEIDFISAEVAQGTDTITLRAVFPNPDGVLRDGALVGVSLEEREASQALTVPQQAIQRDQMGPFVLLVTADSTVELRRVSTGETVLGRTVVAEGLSPGDNVIVEGVNKVRPGITVDAATASNG